MLFNKLTLISIAAIIAIHGHKIAKYCSHCLCVCIRCNSNTLDKRALLNLYNTLDLY